MFQKGTRLFASATIILLLAATLHTLTVSFFRTMTYGGGTDRRSAEPDAA